MDWTMSLSAKRAVLVLVGVVGLLAACTGGGRGVSDPAPHFGDLEGKVTEAQVAELVSYARALLDGKNAPPRDLIAQSPGRRVIVKAHAGARSIAGSGLGANLAESTQAAVESFKGKIKDPKAMRLEVLAINSFAPLQRDEKGDVKLGVAEVGLEGFVAIEGDAFGFVLPGEVVTQELWESQGGNFRLKATQGMLAHRAGVRRPVLIDGDSNHRPFSLYTYRGLSMIESAKEGQAREVIRGLIDRPLAPDADGLRQGARLGAQYLQHNQDGKGHYLFLYEVTEDRPGSNDNSLVQAATAVAMWEAWHVLKDAGFKRSAHKASLWLQKNLSKDVKGTQVAAAHRGLRYLLDNTLAKTGGAARALTALTFAKHEGVKGVEEAAIEGLGKYLLEVQKPDGSIASYFKYSPEARVSGDRGQYMGSALHALLDLHDLTGEARWLAAARRVGDHILKSEKGKAPERLNADYWRVRALAKLSRVTGDPRYGDHGARAASVIPTAQNRRGKVSRDFVGGFGVPPMTMPAAEKLIALTEAAAWERSQGRDPKALIASAREISTFLSRHLLDDESLYFVLNADKARGGVRQGFSSNNIRIDYVHKTISGFLRLAALLDGEALPGWETQAEAPATEVGGDR